MKRLDLVRIIEQNGAVFIRHGSDHDWYKNPNTGIAESVPRHREIKEPLAKKIITNPACSRVRRWRGNLLYWRGMYPAFQSNGFRKILSPKVPPM